jgi:dienelactone hydrolase
MLKAMREKLLVNVGNGMKMRVVTNKVVGKAAVVIVHGLTSYVHEALYEDARRFFNKKGYSVFRPELYGWEKDARNLKDCTLETHGGDLDKLVAVLAEQGYEAVYMAGHSYGCPSIMCMRKPFTKAVMWDGTYVGMPLSFLGDMKYCTKIGAYVDGSGTGLVLGGGMIEEANNLRALGEWVGNLKNPTKLIYAGGGVLHPYRTMQQKSLQCAGIECATSVINGADHNFTDDKVKDKLFKASYNWFSK